MKIGLLFALPEERDAFVRALGPMSSRTSTIIRSGLPFVCRGHHVRIAVTRMGAAGAREAAHHFAEQDIDRLVAAGLAGGLSERLAIGEVVFAARVWRLEETGEIALIHEATQPPIPPNARIGDVITAPRVLVKREEKAALRDGWQSAGNRTDALIVDMESAAAATVAAERNLPFTALRAVSDLVTEDLPLDFNRFVDANGQANRIRIAIHAMTHPSSLRPLLQFGRSSHLACSTLARALLDWFELV